jgi:hypothetical protein
LTIPHRRAGVSGIRSNEWRNTQALDIPAKGLVRVNVPASTLDAAQPGQEDLRIVDSKGDQVPYLIERLLPTPNQSAWPAEFRSTIENGATHLNLLKTGTRAPIVGVSLETPATALHESCRRRRIEMTEDLTKLAGGNSIFPVAERATKPCVHYQRGAWEFLRASPLMVWGRH